MSPASHMVGRLQKLYGIVWRRMQYLNEGQIRPPNGHSATASHCVAEQLEPRLLLSTVYWDGGGDGTSWSDPKNWSADVLPGVTDDVTIDVAANPTISFTGMPGPCRC